MTDTANLAPPTKAAPKEKAVKPPKEKKEPTVRKTSLNKLYPEGAKITLLVDKNPKKQGSASRARFEHYFTSKTVGDYLAAAGKGAMADLPYDVGHGFIKVD